MLGRKQTINKHKQTHGVLDGDKKKRQWVGGGKRESYEKEMFQQSLKGKRESSCI